MKAFEEIAKNHGHCRCASAYIDRGLISPDCEIHDMEEAVKEYTSQFEAQRDELVDEVSRALLVMRRNEQNDSHIVVAQKILEELIQKYKKA